MSLYRAFGLTIRSDHPLPELEPAPAGAAVDVCLRVTAATAAATIAAPEGSWTPALIARGGEPWLSWRREDDGYRLRVHELADFSISRGGDRIAVRPAGGIAPETLRHLVLDSVLPLVLNLHGLDALHASAVLVDGEAVGFLGPSGTGKSTLAAHFVQRGHTALCDDCLVVEVQAGHARARRAYPGLRLWQEAITAVGAAAEPTAPVADYTAKRRVGRPGGRAPVESVPLRALYLLERTAGRTVGVAPIAGAEALMALVRSGFRLDHRDAATMRRQLELWSSILERVSLRVLTVPDDLGALPRVREAVLARATPGLAAVASNAARS